MEKVRLLPFLFLGFLMSCGDDAVDLRKPFLGDWSFVYVKDCIADDASGTMSLEVTKEGNTKILLTFGDGLVVEATVIEKDFALVGSSGYTGSVEVIDGTLDIAIYQDIVCVWTGTASN